MDESILLKPLEELTPEDLCEISHVADSLFARLLRPFMQSRLEYVFSVRDTIRETVRTGQMLPQYERVEKKHRKSNIVIALSLSGIDRCFGCGMLRLLSELRRFISFKLFIYTDTCVEAAFTPDGFLANDYMLAWNNVYTPLAWGHLINHLEQKQDKGESQLLIIDSLGGGDSAWHTHVGNDVISKVVEVQGRYMGGKWHAARTWLKGRYDLFDQIPSSYMPPQMRELIEHNVSTRWVRSPALRDYLIRWLMNPAFGTVRHGQLLSSDCRPMTMDPVLQILREKFSKIHIVLPAQSTEGDDCLSWLIERRFIDFHHKISDLEGFAAMMFNIAHNRATNRVRIAEIQFSDFVMTALKEESDADDAEDDEDTNHSAVSMTGQACFAKIPDERDWLPPCQYFVEERKRGADEVSKRYFSWSELDFGHNALSALDVFNAFDWKVEPYWTEFSRVEKAQCVLDVIANNHLVSLAGMAGVRLVPRPADDDGWREEWLKKVAFTGTTKNPLLPHLTDWVWMLAPSYKLPLTIYPLRHTLWCSVAQFNAKKAALSVTPSDDLTRREDAFHELGHYLQHAAPVVGAYTNTLLEIMTGKEFIKNRLVPVGKGFARPTIHPYKKWILPYAGKWYARHDKAMPNPDEILSVHSEYFRSAAKLVELLEYDPKMVKIVAFCFMGGPQALLGSLQDVKRRDALNEIAQRSERSYSYGTRKTRTTVRYTRTRKSSKKTDESRSPGL